MAGLLKKMRRLSNAKLDNLHLYYAGMSLDEFCEVSEIPQFVDQLRREGATTVEDVCHYHKDLASSCGMGVVHRAKLSSGVRHYKAAKKKNLMRPAVPVTGGSTGASEPSLSRGGSGNSEGADRRHSVVGLPAAPMPTPPQSVPTASTSDLLTGPPEEAPTNYGMPIVSIANEGGGESHDYEEFDDTHDYEEPETGQLYEDPDKSAQTADGPGHAQGSGGAKDAPAPPLRNRPDFVRQEPEVQPLPADPEEWSNSEVLRYLRENELSDFKDIIYANGFDGTQLLQLTANQFKSKFSADRCMALAKALGDLKHRALEAKKEKLKSKTTAAADGSDKPGRGRAASHTMATGTSPPRDVGEKTSSSAQHSGSGTIGHGVSASNSASNVSQGSGGQRSGVDASAAGDYNRLPPPQKLKAEMAESTGKVVRALHDFDATSSDQLSFKQDEALTILDDSSLWWMARNERGQEGFVPSNFVELAMSIPSTTAAGTSPSSSSASTHPAASTAQTTTTTTTSSGSIPDEEQPWFLSQMSSRVGAERLLKAQSKVGTFMIRPSASNPNSRTLSILGTSNTVIHLKVLHDARGYYLGGTDIFHESLADLVTYFQQTEIKVSSRDPVLLTQPCPAN